MKSKFRYFSVVLILNMLISVYQQVQADYETIITLSDPKKIGEVKQVQGIRDELNLVLKAKKVADIRTSDFNVSDGDEFLQDVLTNLNNPENKHVVVIASGESTVEILRKLYQSTQHKNLFTVYSSHQLTQAQEDLKGYVNLFAIPKHAIDESKITEFEKAATKVVTTTGVAHNLKLNNQGTREALVKEIPSLKIDRTPTRPRLMGVMLAGDAEGINKNEILFYSKDLDEINSFADYIAFLIRDYDAAALIFNGPRTGKHDPETGQEIHEAHRNPDNLDRVTQAFIDRLEQKNLKRGKDFILYDFQHGQPKPSLYEIALALLYEEKAPILMPGESTTMVSEAADNLPHGNVTVYTHSAMNPNHIKHYKSEFNAGRVNGLEFDTHKEAWVRKKADIKGEVSVEPASVTIATISQKKLHSLRNFNKGIIRIFHT